jgi:hypothetical protein
MSLKFGQLFKHSSLGYILKPEIPLLDFDSWLLPTHLCAETSYRSCAPSARSYNMSNWLLAANRRLHRLLLLDRAEAT